ncbi:MAG: SpoIID/LytB domain-containing protein, partial [Elusimicrobia bacterium]|nr:SpoIID/LytB domain-containing protein [Elusimicrobiota bacterium]
NFGLYEQAREHLINVLRKDPSFVEARLPLAGIYIREGKYNEAWNQYERVLDYAPNHPLAKEMLNKIRGKLTAQPEDIRPPFKIKNPTVTEYVDAINELKKSPNIRVALGANNKGEQWRNKSVKIRSFGKLKVIGKRSGKEFAVIYPGDIWEIKYSNGSLSLKSPSGEKYENFTGVLKIVPQDKKNGTFIIESQKDGSNPYFRYSDREYRGWLEVYPYNQSVALINVVPLEIYLLGVVPAEMEPKWPLEALKAQAILARTQAVLRAQSGPHKKQGYHICDTEHCQVYRGVNIENNNSNNAVLETEGEILTYHGKPAYCFYHSNSGGYIQASEEVSGWGKVPYLVTKADFIRGDILSPWEFNIWIKESPPSYSNYPGVVKDSEYRWMKIIKKKDLEYKLNRDYAIGELLDITPLKRSGAGNVNSVRIRGSKKTVIIEKEHLIRNAFGFSSLKSTLFMLETNRFKNRKIRNFWFYGGGWGHSIGMSQSGAAGMAGKYGNKAEEILDFYFPQTKIKKLKYVKKKPGDR